MQCCLVSDSNETESNEHHGKPCFIYGKSRVYRGSSFFSIFGSEHEIVGTRQNQPLRGRGGGGGDAKEHNNLSFEQKYKENIISKQLINVITRSINNALYHIGN